MTNRAMFLSSHLWRNAKASSSQIVRLRKKEAILFTGEFADYALGKPSYEVGTAALTENGTSNEKHA